jgi:hypothetical protein
MTADEVIRTLRKDLKQTFDIELLSGLNYEINTHPPFILYEYRQVNQEIAKRETSVNTLDKMTENKYFDMLVKVVFTYVNQKRDFYNASKIWMWFKHYCDNPYFVSARTSQMTDLSTQKDNYRYRWSSYFRFEDRLTRTMNRIDTLTYQCPTCDEAKTIWLNKEAYEDYMEQLEQEETEEVETP